MKAAEGVGEDSHQKRKRRTWKKMTNEIKDAKDSGLKMWKIIDRLKSIKTEEKDSPLHDCDGAVMEEVRRQDEMIKWWMSIY